MIALEKTHNKTKNMKTLSQAANNRAFFIGFVNNQLPLPVSGLLRLVETARLIF